MPFWADLPHSDIFRCITSDLLHQLHQGLFKDYLKKWSSAIVGKTKFDMHFRAMPFHPGLQHFNKGISKVKQWTGGDHKQLEQVFLPALVGTTPHREVIHATQALLDFIYVAQYQSQTDETLHHLQHSLDEFHTHKDIFIELGCRKHFNIPKLHLLQHYIDSIKLFGSLDSLNTENSEQLHINYAKRAYAASNRKDYTIQMMRWLTRQEAVCWFKTYLAWYKNSNHLAVSDSEAVTTSMPSRTTVMLQDYRLGLHPHFPKKTAQYLVQHHGAIKFLDALKAFVSTLPSGRQFEANVHNRFDCFSNVVIPLPCKEHVLDSNSTRVHCHPERPNGPHKPPTPARFDTMLVTEDAEERCLGGLHGM